MGSGIQNWSRIHWLLLNAAVTILANMPINSTIAEITTGAVILRTVSGLSVIIAPNHANTAVIRTRRLKIISRVVTKENAFSYFSLGDIVSLLSPRLMICLPGGHCSPWAPYFFFLAFFLGRDKTYSTDEMK